MRLNIYLLFLLGMISVFQMNAYANTSAFRIVLECERDYPVSNNNHDWKLIHCDHFPNYYDGHQGHEVKGGVKTCWWLGEFESKAVFVHKYFAGEKVDLKSPTASTAIAHYCHFDVSRTLGLEFSSAK